MQLGHKLEAYLPVRTDIRSKGNHTEECEELFSESIILSRVLLLENLYYCTDDILRSLVDGALVDICVQISVQKELRMHIVMGPYD